MAFCTGCEATTAQASKPAVVFPSREELARIPSREARPEAFGTEDAPVDDWTFEAQIATDAAAYDDASAWGDLARGLVKDHPANAVLSAPLRCAAQELARFHLAKNAMPTESLRRFMAARCGAATPGMTPVIWTVKTSAPMSDEELARKAREAIAKRLGARLDHGHHLVAAAAARDGQRVSVVAVIAADEARLEPGSLSVDASRRVTLRGEARSELTDIAAMVNRGDVGASPCMPDRTVLPPRFAITCELAQGDAFAWVEIVGRRKGQVLERELAEALIHEGDGSAIAYTARHVGPPAPITSGAEFSRALLDRLNGVRTAAHLPALVLAQKQSAENTRLAGTLINASLGDDDETADRAAVGLLAGWDVPGLIRSGSLFLGAVGPTNDATAWLDFALERPIGRSALLDPNARQVALGPAIPPGGGALGAAVTTYTMFESDDHAADETRFFERIAAARAARGLPAPVRVQGLGEMEAELARVARQEVVPMAALQTTMEIAVARTGQGVRGSVLETNDIDRANVPPALLGPGQLHVMVGVTHHRAEGAAWGQYVIVAVVLGGG
jgi:hypothetical protein